MSFVRESYRVAHPKVVMHPRSRQFNNTKNVENPKPQKSLKKGIILIMLLLLLGLVAVAFLKVIWLNYQLEKELQSYLLQEQELIEQQSALEQEIESLQDPLVIERLARERLGFVKAGERIVIPARPGELPVYIEPKEGELQH